MRKQQNHLRDPRNEHPGIPTFRDARDEAEKKYLVTLLDECRGNVSEAAAVAREYRVSLYRLLKKHGISAEDYRREQ